MRMRMGLYAWQVYAWLMSKLIHDHVQANEKDHVQANEKANGKANEKANEKDHVQANEKSKWEGRAFSFVAARDVVTGGVRQP